MNKNIERIIQESGLYIAYDNKEVTDSELSFFAEMIVRECASLAYDGPDGILEHFGVECDCGCNDPVATTPQEMLEFLAGRFEYAGVSEAVAKSYARDIRKIMKEHFGVDS